MPNNFKVKTFDGSSTAADTAMTIYTCPGSTETTVIGMSIANIGTTQCLVDVILETDTVDVETNSTVFIVKAAPVPVGSSLIVVGGDQKVVLQPTDVIKVESDTANSIDTTLSILEIS
jgi:hypothetical protein